jgi:hypothetical protein
VSADPIESSDYLAHYGILRRSGRYPYGSGQNGAAPFPWSLGSTENVRNRRFLEYFDAVAAEAKKQGKPTNRSITETCKLLGISTTEYRAARTLANAQQKQVQIKTAQRLKDKGWSNTQIAQHMFNNPKQESTVRSLLDNDTKYKADALQNIAKTLEDGVKSKRYIDVGTGVEQYLGVSPDRLRAAVALLQQKGYEIIPVQIPQLGTAPGNKTTIKVLAPPGSKYKGPDGVNANRHLIQQLDALGSFTKDNGHSMLNVAPPLSISSKRVQVKYGNEGGDKADGVIYVRPGVKDLSMQGSHYAQVRIMVDDTHFLKGMAVLRDDLPPGVDLQFNTTKLSTGNKLDAMKPLKTKKLDDGTEVIDHDNPFGAQLKQSPRGQVLDLHGKVTSVMNVVNEEGDWNTWSRNLSSQFLSKQAPPLARRQLDKTFDDRRGELDEIMNLTNPVVKKKLLESFADGVDSSAVDLKAAAFKDQTSHVILPVPSMKPNEVYAPNFNHGDTVVLVRYPHGGTFEIPELTVNNRQRAARAAFGPHPPDAIGIHPNVAKRLSGADFDGDSVIVIPQRASTKVKVTDPTKDPELLSLSKFEPQREFPAYDGMHTIDGGRYNASTGKVDYGEKGPRPAGKQQQMGRISNLITDMTIKGAPNNEIARAVKHSMVVIDAEKHALDYKGSEEFHNIKALREKYQPAGGNRRAAGGASTLISRAGSRTDVRAFKERGIDPVTGRKIRVPKGESFVDGKGVERFPTVRSTKLAEVRDAFKLTSGGSKETPGTTVEAVYANHSNRLKDMADLARLESVRTAIEKGTVPSAVKAYDMQVKSLNAKLDLAIRNRPLERQAQVYANQTLKAKKADYPDMDEAQEKRIKFQALAQARARVGADKQTIDITPQEWQAIQARAISPSRLSSILDHADLETIKSFATPRQTLKVQGTDLSRARQLIANGHTQFEVAQQLGISVTTLKNSMKGGV